MVKAILTLSLCTVLGTSLQARDLDPSRSFIGLEVGAATIQGDTGAFLLGEPDHKGSDVEYGFRLGTQTNAWRTMFVFNFFDSSDDDQNYEKGFLELDYFFLNDDDTSSDFRPYIGANLGYMNYESTNIDSSGILYGGQAGFAYKIMDTVDLDIMYRYSLTDADNTDHIESVVFGLNYLY